MYIVILPDIQLQLYLYVFVNMLSIGIAVFSVILWEELLWNEIVRYNFFKKLIYSYVLHVFNEV